MSSHHVDLLCRFITINNYKKWSEVEPPPKGEDRKATKWKENTRCHRIQIRVHFPARQAKTFTLGPSTGKTSSCVQIVYWPERFSGKTWTRISPTAPWVRQTRVLFPMETFSYAIRRFSPFYLIPDTDPSKLHYKIVALKYWRDDFQIGIGLQHVHIFEVRFTASFSS